MTRNRWIAIAAIGVLMLGVYAFARKGEPVNTNAAVENKALTASPTPAVAANALEASATDNKFYGVDYEAGLKAGKEAGLAGATELISTERPAYNEGYKAGLQEGIKEKNSPRPTTVVRRYNSGGRTVVYRNAGTTTTARKKNSTLKTVLQIAAPAAIGAGIGAAAGGGKGAAAGAAIGGGAGAIYTIIKNKN